jgi:hypothetical protein
MTNPKLEDYIIILRNEFNELLNPYKIKLSYNCDGLDVNLDYPVSTLCISYVYSLGRIFREDEYLCFESNPYLYQFLPITKTGDYSITTHISVKHSILLADPECFDKIVKLILHTKDYVLNTKN